MSLAGTYKIRKVTNLDSIGLTIDSNRGVWSFEFYYNTEEGRLFFIRYLLSEYWLNSQEGDISLPFDDELNKYFSEEAQMKSNKKVMEQKRFAALFFKKSNNFLKKNNYIVSGSGMVTKLIRMTADNLKQDEQILLTRSALISCELEDLLM